jgi:hypothetical protein
MASRTTRLAILLCACTSSAAFAGSPRICALAANRAGLSQYAVAMEPNQDGDRIVTADIDRDGTADTLKWFSPGSGSLISADPSNVTLTLNANGKSFTLEQQHLYVAKFESTYYVVTGWLETEQGPWHKDIFAVTAKGFSQICSFTGSGQRQ